MSNDNCGPDPVDRHTREAAQWLADLDDPKLPPEELLRWNDWLQSEPNRRAFDDLEALSRVADAAALDINSTRLISEEAAYWYVMYAEQADMQLSDHRDFLAWLRSSTKNVRELVRIAQLDRELRGLKHVPDSKRNVSFKLTASAASVVIGAGLAFVVVDRMQSEQVVTTGASQWQHMTLPDGTALHIDARSKIEVSYTDKQRIVHVYRGSAVFEVATDPMRPFIARTRLIDAMATGTRFGVSIDPGVTTTVSEGAVKVTLRGKPNAPGRILRAGDELRVPNSSLASSQVARVDADRKLQWTNGMLILSGMTVAEGVEQFNRRNRTQIVVESAALGAQIVPLAVVKVDAPEVYARVIAEEPGIKITWDRKNDVIRLSE
jgi:transmembrane sensor